MLLPLVAFSLFFVFFGVLALVQALKNLRTKRRFRALPRRPLGELRGEVSAGRGDVRLAGDSQPLSTPLGGIPCVYYRLQVFDPHHRSGDVGAREQLALVKQDEQTAPFLVEDESGTARVELEGAELQVHERRLLTGIDRPENNTPELLQTLRDLGVEVELDPESVVDLFGAVGEDPIRTLDVRQRWIATSDELFLMGPVSCAGPQPTFQGGAELLVSNRFEAEIRGDVEQRAVALPFVIGLLMIGVPLGLTILTLLGSDPG